jgi:type IX secretion system PorP/SprF family membrane protein
MNFRFKIIIQFTIFLMVIIAGNSQQLPLYSQYMMNKFLLNPAIAGSDGYTSVNFTAREQWVGFMNAPRTHAISGQTRILKTSYISKSTSVRKKITRPSRSGRVGIGGYIFNDRNGIISRTGFQLTYAYHIDLSETARGPHRLSFGISANAFQFQIDDDGINTENIEYDEFWENYDKVMFIPDANFGVYYSTRDYYAGFSAHNLFKSVLQLGIQGESNYKMLRHYYIMGGYTFELPNPDFAIQPSALFKSSDDLHSFQVEVSAKVFYQDNYWGGISFRSSDALIIMAGLKVDQYYFGYAFDYALSNIRKHSLGSHEFMVAVKFGDNARRYRWLDRY